MEQLHEDEEQVQMDEVLPEGLVTVKLRKPSASVLVPDSQMPQEQLPDVARTMAACAGATSSRSVMSELLPSGTVFFLEGCHVAVEQHLSPEEPGSYLRLVALCPLGARGGHAKCRKCRNFSDARMARLGPYEPFGFCGAWLAAATAFPDRATHMRFSPSEEAVAGYLQAAGLPLGTPGGAASAVSASVAGGSGATSGAP